jgi:hypothetical protein
VRAQQLTGDPWAEDPGCYLEDAEIGLQQPSHRIEITPFKHRPRTITVRAA